MKLLGYIFIAIGLGLLFFVGYVLLSGGQETISPVPDTSGVKVIQLTPAP